MVRPLEWSHVLVFMAVVLLIGIVALTLPVIKRRVHNFSTSRAGW